MLAKSMKWQLSGSRVSGMGTKEDFYEALAGSWQPVVSDLLSKNIFTVVDTEQGIIGVAHELMLDVDGRGNGPTCIVRGKNIYTITVDKDHKINSFSSIWDPNDARLKECLKSAHGPNLVKICNATYLNFRTHGKEGSALTEFWAPDATVEVEVPDETTGMQAVSGHDNIMQAFGGGGGEVTGKVQGELPAGGAAGFFTDKPTKFKRVGDSVYVYEDVPTAMGHTMKGLAIHTFDDQGKCVHTAPYHFLYTTSISKMDVPYQDHLKQICEDAYSFRSTGNDAGLALTDYLHCFNRLLDSVYLPTMLGGTTEGGGGSSSAPGKEEKGSEPFAEAKKFFQKKLGLFE